MKNKKLLRISFLLLAVLMFASAVLPVYGAASYQTYTYAIDGFAARSPDAYTPYKTYHAKDMGLNASDFGTLNDIVVDGDNNVYLADSGNNCIWVFSEYMQYKFKIQSFINEEGIRDSLLNPEGVFVTSDKIYVADTNNARIAVFDRNGSFLYQLREPKSTVFPANSVYRPIALAVDNSGRIYVVSSTTYMGVIILDADGVFQNFIGAQTVSAGAAQLFINQFLSGKRRASAKKSVPTEYNNITIDSDGFVYVTSSSIKEEQQTAAIFSKSSTYSPVKKLNSSGNDVMARNGFFGPGGEVISNGYDWGTEGLGASKIVDAAVGPEGTWSIIDEKRSRVYTYDDEGNLLFAFGDKGQQLGNLSTVSGIAYQDSKMLLLDKSDAGITVFNRTEYGDVLISALKHNNDREYDLAVSDWETILQYNNNFDTAYVGIGRSYFRNAEWEKAMEYYQTAYDTANYSNSFKMWRQEWVSKYVLIVPVVVIAFCVAIVQYFKWAKKINKAATLKTGKRSYKEEFLYSAHLIFHPFDGFWDLKHEHRGSVRVAVTFMTLTVAAFAYQAVGGSYLYGGGGTNIIMQLLSVMIPIILFITANWCLTTLFEGEGSFKDIFIATGYSLAPLPFFIVLSTLLTHIMTLEESGIISMLSTLGFVWVGLLLFFGVMITHDYGLLKNILTIIGTIVGMAFIMFMAILFSTLIGKIVGFVSNIVTELSFRA